MRILHTMLRTGDLDRSIKFYTEVLGMKLLRRKDYPAGEFTLAFLGYGDESDHTVIELTYNWGVDRYEMGTAYGHIACLRPYCHRSQRRLQSHARSQGSWWQDSARGGSNECGNYDHFVYRRPRWISNRTDWQIKSEDRLFSSRDACFGDRAGIDTDNHCRSTANYRDCQSSQWNLAEQKRRIQNLGARQTTASHRILRSL